jgi:hypothetical protein
VSDSAGLEHAYRRLVACYPRSFRREHGEEILTVLLATAREGQRRPGIAESADLMRGAVRMRMGLSRAPRTVLNAVRLMYLGALAELGVLVTLLLTEGSVQAAVLRRNPQLSEAMLASPMHRLFIADTVVISIAIAVWLCVAWANGTGLRLARGAAIGCFVINTAGMIGNLATGSAGYAPATMIAGGVVWLIGMAAIVLVCQKQSSPYYARH